MNIKKAIFLILILIWMIIIFCFSHQSSGESSATSGKTIRAILNITPGVAKLDEEQKAKIVEYLQPIARKLAHFTIYAVGGVVMILYFNEYNLSDRRRLMFSGTLGCIYAITDEIHQLFIPR